MPSMSQRFNDNFKANRATISQLMSSSSNLAPNAATSALRRVLEVGIDGVSRFPSAKVTAAAALGRRGSAESAIDALIRQHLALAGAQGFLTNLGGIETMAITMPANVSGMAIVQARMVAGIAHLRGYDIDDQRVRGAVLMCLIGEKGVHDLVDKGELPSPLVVATAPVIDDTLHARITEKVMAALVQNATGKRVTVVASKRIPLVGGGVGAAADGYTTWGIAQYAKSQFVSRRR